MRTRKHLSAPAAQFALPALMLTSSWTALNIGVGPARVAAYDVLLVALLPLLLWPLRATVRWTGYIPLAAMVLLELVQVARPGERSINSLAGLIVGLVSLHVGLALASHVSPKAVRNAVVLVIGTNLLAAVVQALTVLRGTGLARFPTELGSTAVGAFLIVVAIDRRSAYCGRLLHIGLAAGAAILALLSGGRSAALSVAFLLVFATVRATVQVRNGQVVVRPVALLLSLTLAGAATQLRSTIEATPVGQRAERISINEDGYLPPFLRENWGDGLSELATRPLTGTTWEGLTIFSRQFGREFTVHNTPLALLVATGAVGTLLFACALRFGVRRSVRLQLSSRLLLLGIVPHMLFHNLLSSRSLWLCVGVFLGMTLKSDRAPLQPE